MEQRVLYNGKADSLSSPIRPKRNENIECYTLLEAVAGAGVFVCQLDVVLLYFAVFEFTQRRFLDTGTLLQCTAGFVLATEVARWLCEKSAPRALLKSGVVFLLFGYGFTPLIRTLTTSTSTDTIYALAAITFSLGLVFYDYGLSVFIVSSPLALNLNLAASVFLISRVRADSDAFLLLTLAVEAFSSWSRLRRLLLARTRWALVLTTLLSMTASGLALARISALHLLLASLLHAVVLLVCPVLLLVLQNFKNTIHGPWDIAHLKP